MHVEGCVVFRELLVEAEELRGPDGIADDVSRLSLLPLGRVEDVELPQGAVIDLDRHIALGHGKLDHQSPRRVHVAAFDGGEVFGVDAHRNASAMRSHTGRLLLSVLGAMTSLTSASSCFTWGGGSAALI